MDCQQIQSDDDTEKCGQADCLQVVPSQVHLGMLAAQEDVLYTSVYGGRGGQPFGTSSCPGPSFATQITLQQDLTGRLTGITLRCNDANATLVSQFTSKSSSSDVRLLRHDPGLPTPLLTF